MTSNGSGDDEPPAATSTPSPRQTREDGPFVLRSLLGDVPLSADGSQHDIKINCVDYLGQFHVEFH